MVKKDEPQLGTLHLFADLPDEATQHAFVDETLEAIREQMERFDPTKPPTSSDMSLMRDSVEEDGPDAPLSR